jgi:parallel beta-helix repeat protein
MSFRFQPFRRLSLCLVVAGAACSDQVISAPETTPPFPETVAAIDAAVTVSATLVGAGNVARCDRTNDEATGRLLDNIPGTVFTTGDNVFASGSATDYTNCYGPSWGRHKSRTRPTPGDLDYQTAGASGYFGYFGNAAGSAGAGYYSYDLGDWHVVALNSTVSTAAGSPQEQWLRADLAASPKRCTVAYWHHPRFSSSGTARRDEVKPLWDALYAAGVELVLNGHYRVYERFAPQTPDGVADPATGIRQFTVGTGGISTNSFGAAQPNSELRRTNVYGVLQLTLATDAYTWRFVPGGGKKFSDSGSGACHDGPAGPGGVASVAVTPPSANISVDQTVQFGAVARDADGATLPATMSWRSSDSLKAVVSAAGLVTGIAAGTAYVIATADGKSDTAVVTVAAPSCEVASSTWLNKPFARQTGSFTAEYDATPSGSGVDGVTGLAPAAAADYPDLAAIVRFSPSGTIDARNGSVYAALKPIPYTAGARYRVRLAVNVPARTYSAFVTPPGGAEEVIGNGLAFRTEQANATDLEDWSARTSAGTLSLCGFTLSGAAAPAPVASVGVSPASASLAVGDTVRLVATPRDADGNALTGRSVTWTTSGAAVATVSSTGLVTGMGAGTATISATSEGRTGVATVTVTTSATTRPGFHVSPAGSSANDGSASRPWSLTYALSGAGGRIQPGDTVWLRNGTYAGSFRTSISGTQSQPIVFRQYPGERATIDGGLRAEGADLVFWGFEIMQSNPTGNGELPGLLIYTLRGKFINLVVHDAAQQGITFWDGADDAEVYGSIVYNNGLEENKDHGIYIHGSSGIKTVEDNIFFNNLAYGIHAYAGPTAATQRNIHVIGNVAFNNGSISSLWTERVNMLIGGEVRYEGMKALGNMLYFSGTVGRNMWIGYTAANRDAEVRDNIVWGGASVLEVTEWDSAILENNIFGGTSQMVDLRDATPQGQAWQGNRYYRSPTASAWRFDNVARPLSTWQAETGLGLTDLAVSSTPTTPAIYVRPNRYEAGRAHVVVYNWPQWGSVSVNLSGVLAVGRRYEVRNAQAPYGAPVASGTYGGGSITLPMSGIAPPTPIGRSTRTPPRTGPVFDAFLITQP